MLLALRRVSLACREGGGLRKPEEPASKTRSARILAPWNPGWVIGYTASPLCKLSCLIIGDQRCPPPSLNLSHCPSVVSPLLFARCVAIGESGFASSHIFIYSELNRHGISRKRENADVCAVGFGVVCCPLQ